MFFLVAGVAVSCASPAASSNLAPVLGEPNGALPIAALENASPVELLRRGNAALKDQRRYDALLAFECAWNQGARTPGLEVAIARLWLQAGDPRAALTWAGRSAPDKSPGPLAMIRAGAFRLLGNVKRAREEAEKCARSDDPETAGKARLMLGQLASEAGDETQAVREFTEAARLGVSDPSLQLFLGARAYNQKEYARAVEHLARAGNLAPRYQLALAGALLDTGEPEKARAALIRYVEVNGLDRHARGLIRRLP